MDRIDVQLWLHPVKAGALVRKIPSESSAVVAERVRRARDIQQKRLSGEGIFTNAEMNHRQTERFCPLDKGCRDLMEKIISRMGLSARAFTRVIRLARTIADLASLESISQEHLMEAASYRFLDRRDLDL
nr:magnesium chelatase [Bacteroidales bacterium]